MTQHELTAPERAATSPHANGEGAGPMGRQGQGRRRAMMAGAAMLSVALGGCINIAAPDAPIVIELNINIRQEVIYRLAQDAANTIDENADIF
ncbi:MAG TPA: YnbE family lipoprotein [Erythrobacter sp.]|nr:YnbE family lipoprotein [Erythrobacter sp.]